MFVKQIDLAGALKLAAKGQEVKVMAPSVPEPEKWTDYETDTLGHMLEGCLFFRDEPAMTDETFEAEVGEIPPPASKTKSAPAKPVDSGTKRKKVDTGKILALRKAGWSMKKIGEELGISEGSVWNYLNRLEGEHGDAKD